MNLLDLIFPKNCLGCNKAGKYICDQCISKVPKARPRCPECNYFSFGGKTHSSCLKKISLGGHFAVWQYGGIVRKGIHAFKYRYASDIANDLIEHVPRDIIKLKNPLLIPIPLHSSREKWRGFNQSELIAKKLAQKNGWKYADNALIRIENTTPQAHLGKEERVRNMRGKFAVNDYDLSLITRHSSFILVDDVWTTGSTMKEAAKVLKKAGVKDARLRARQVWGFTLAS